MIQLTKDGIAGTVNLEGLARQFEESHVFRLAQLLHSDLVQMISSRLETCEWTTRDDGKIAREAEPTDLAPANILTFATNTLEFLNLMRVIARCPEIKYFSGRVYRMAATADHFDSWHSDLGDPRNDRLVGMSINLSHRPYQGGLFRLRDEASGEILCQLPNTGRGDALFFRISPALKHMVTPIEGSEPKTAFAGWFQSGKTDFYSRLRLKSVPAPTDVLATVPQPNRT